MELLVNTKKHTYAINLQRRRSVLMGDSGTGKSKLLDYVDNFLRFGKGGGSIVQCHMNVAVVREEPSESWFSEHSGHLILVDEDVRFSDRGLFFKRVEEYKCWLLFVSRCLSVTGFDCAVNSVYKLVTTGNTTVNKPLFIMDKPHRTARQVYTEDEGSGFEFFKQIRQDVDTLHGKDTVRKNAEDYLDSTWIVDGAAFGTIMMSVWHLYENGYVDIVAEESFEYMLLRSRLLRNNTYVSKALSDKTAANDFKFYSWEKYYTHVLTSVLSTEAHTTYGKGDLVRCFRRSCCPSKCNLYTHNVDRVMCILEDNDLLWLVQSDIDYSKYAAMLPPSIRSQYSNDKECVEANISAFKALGIEIPITEK